MSIGTVLISGPQGVDLAIFGGRYFRLGAENRWLGVGFSPLPNKPHHGPRASTNTTRGCGTQACPKHSASSLRCDCCCRDSGISGTTLQYVKSHVTSTTP